MGNGFAETPLALFTTLAPMGAGAFLMIALSYLMFKFDDEVMARIDKMTLVPLGVLIVGFIAAFFHLASPLNAFGVFVGLGSSPLSNEIAAGSLFALMAIVYVALAMTGKLTAGLRKIFSIILIVLAVVFFVFCGLAYIVPTIPTWNGAGTIIQMIGYGTISGAVLATLVFGLAKINVDDKLRNATVIVAAAGLIIGAFGFGMQILAAGSISNIWGSAMDLVPMIWALFAFFIIGGLVAIALMYRSAAKGFAPTFTAVAAILIAVAIFMARIGFYGLFMSIAL